MIYEEVKQKRLENLKIYNELILPDINSFFIEKVDNKCDEKIETLFNSIIKNFIYGRKKVVIDFNTIDIFDKKNAYDTVGYQRTLVIDDNNRLNYSIDLNENKEWEVVSDNLRIPFSINIYAKLTMKLENRLKNFFGNDININVDNKVYTLTFNV